MVPGKFSSTILLVFLFGMAYADNKPDPEPQRDNKTRIFEEEKMQLRSLSLNTIHTLKTESKRWEDELLMKDLSTSEEKISDLQLRKPLNIKEELNRSLSRWEDTLLASN